MTDTVYLLIEKTRVLKKADGSRDIKVSPYSRYASARLYATRKEAANVISDPKVMEEYTVLRMKPNFPEGHFVVVGHSDFGNRNHTVGRFAELKDALTVAPGHGEWGTKGDVVFHPTEGDEVVYADIASWKKGAKVARPADVRLTGSNSDLNDFTFFEIL